MWGWQQSATVTITIIMQSGQEHEERAQECHIHDAPYAREWLRGRHGHPIDCHCLH